MTQSTQWASLTRMETDFRLRKPLVSSNMTCALICGVVLLCAPNRLCLCVCVCVCVSRCIDVLVVVCAQAMVWWADDGSRSKSSAPRTTRAGCTGRKRARASWASNGRSTGLCWRRRLCTGTPTSWWVRLPFTKRPFYDVNAIDCWNSSQQLLFLKTADLLE